MNNKKILLLILIFICSITIIYAAEDDGKKMFESMCDKCHQLERALKQTKDQDAWERTTLRMAKKTLGAITDEDAKKIAKYLADLWSAKKNENHEEKHVEDPDFGFKKVKVDQFIKSEICADCHSEIYKQWQGSMHSKAYVDPLWQKATKLFFTQITTKGQALEMKACVKCHTPLGFRSYSIFSPADDFTKLAELPSEGIFCNWCHNINEVKHLGNAGYEVDTGNGGEKDPSTMLGPYKDSSSDYHPTKYSELHTKSDFCGLCHNVSHSANNLPIEQTYNEWKNSPYNTGNPETTVHCQDCHMRQRPKIPATGKTQRPDNPGKAADNGPNRKHIWTHYFVGGNSLVPKLLGSEIHSEMAIERLTNAANLELIKKPSYKKGDFTQIKVKVINSGAGHYLPTGLTEVRQMWLDVKIIDNAGKLIFRSGHLDENGEIEQDAVIYHTELGDSDDDVVTNVALAEKILYDHRIPPKGYALEKYDFTIPDDAASPLKIEVSLKYRSASPSLVKKILGENSPQILIVDMVNLTDKIELK